MIFRRTCVLLFCALWLACGSTSTPNDSTNNANGSLIFTDDTNATGTTNNQNNNNNGNTNNNNNNNDDKLPPPDGNLEKVDTDGDGVLDSEEAFCGTNPTLIDSDGDCLLPNDSTATSCPLDDFQECFVLTDCVPTNGDSDGDGVGDLSEFNLAHNVLAGTQTCQEDDHDNDGSPAADDCDDNNPAKHPNVIDTLDGVDTNCKPDLAVCKINQIQVDGGAQVFPGHPCGPDYDVFFPLGTNADDFYCAAIDINTTTKTWPDQATIGYRAKRISVANSSPSAPFPRRLAYELGLQQSYSAIHPECGPFTATTPGNEMSVEVPYAPTNALNGCSFSDASGNPSFFSFNSIRLNQLAGLGDLRMQLSIGMNYYQQCSFGSYCNQSAGIGWQTAGLAENPNVGVTCEFGD